MYAAGLLLSVVIGARQFEGTTRGCEYGVEIPREEK